MHLNTVSSGNAFDEELQIDMKEAVGDAVGNMSISPTNRNVVLAARKGLFIIDLDAPLEVPHFFPQGGTWDVVDVQWNPHPSHANYIISTSSEKLLIWNLLLDGKTSIEYILNGHYRAITDINWHNFDPNLVVSTAIDGWIWAWDLRTPQKPIHGLFAFNAGGTQVKWNKLDGNILASSHMKQILIWDRRRGSLPVSKIEAHSAKIYGIDWSNDKRNELVTCSLDRTIKVFDIEMTSPDDSSVINVPKIMFQTTYPVWRARDLPFGQGILSLPQRGETALEMYARDKPQTPFRVFEGHTDVVKEFVWRRGGQDGDKFQLITWSKDRTLRFWPIDAEVIKGLGPKTLPPLIQSKRLEGQSSYHGRPPLTPRTAQLSAPVRNLLAEVRALAPAHQKPLQIFPQSRQSDPPAKAKQTSQHNVPSISILNRRYSTMTRGNVAGKSAPMDTITWWSSVKVGERKEGSSDQESIDSDNVTYASRRRSKSNSREKNRVTKVSENKIKGDEETKENDLGQSLQDEITHVITKLASYKITLEKHDLTKKMTCTLGLHGPWGENSSVFIRVTFTFPKDYPLAMHPGGTPTIDLERNPLISLNDRAFMLRRLKFIRETHRPCLEFCLRFLLTGNENERSGAERNAGGLSSDDDEVDTRVGAAPDSSKGEDVPFMELRNDKNLAEPRTSQGVFGPNGELVCFSRAPPRIVRNPLHEMSVSPSVGSQQRQESGPRLFRSPALLSDAITQLTLASRDRAFVDNPRKREDASNILRIMANLLTFTKRRRLSERSRPSDEKAYSLLPTRRSTVIIKDTSHVLHADRQVASHYIFDVFNNPRETCRKNAALARKWGRFDHERVFQVLKMFVESKEMHASRTNKRSKSGGLNDPAEYVLTKLYGELGVNKDVQMLAMVSVIILRFDSSPIQPQEHLLQYQLESRPLPNYYNGTVQDSSVPIFPHASAVRRDSTSLSSVSSSRGSWSSLFNTGSMRHLVASPDNAMHTEMPGQIAVPGGDLSRKRIHKATSDSPLKKPITKSVPDGSSSIVPSKTVARPLGRRPTVSQIVSSNVDKQRNSKKLAVVTWIPEYESNPAARVEIDPGLRARLISHINSYAEMLLRWQLLRQRAELIKSVKFHSTPSSDDFHLGVARICQKCGKGTQSPAAPICSSCKYRVKLPKCSFCQLSVKGLSRSCVRCGHILHMQCYRAYDEGCATGCGCTCTEVFMHNISS